MTKNNTNNSKKSIGQIIIDNLLEHELIVQGFFDELQKGGSSKDRDLYIIDSLKQKFKEEPFNELINYFIDNGVFSHDEYIKIIENKTENIFINEDVKIEEEIINDKLVETSKQDKDEEKNKKKIFSYKEIHDLIKKGTNLYKEVPGDCIATENEIEYAKIQLYRLIDSGGSDIIFETQKKDGKIQNKIFFKMNSQELQYKTELKYEEDLTEDNENIFFDKVVRYICTNMSGDIQLDKSHVGQDGGMSLEYKKRIHDFRLNIVPTRTYNNTVNPRLVIRHESDGNNIDFESIEMLDFVKNKYHKMIQNKIEGAIIITGPTGSGKTTTIYGMLNSIDKEKNGILSVEKPIESRIYGLNQTQEDSILKPEGDRYNVEKALKCILRQALDVIFIGEMRTSEEIKEGIRIGLIGNKLITTLHTNNCVDTILRLLEEGVTRNAIGNGVKFITAQRLLPKLCPHCSISDEKTSLLVEEISKSFRFARENLRVKLNNFLINLNKEELDSLDLLEFSLGKKLNFLSKEDIDGILEGIKTNIDVVQKGDIDKIQKLVNNLTELYPNNEVRLKLKDLLDEKNINIRKRNINGCNHENCRNGYAGRAGIFEVLELDKSIRKFIQDPSTKLIELEEFLAEKGFATLKHYGYMLMLMGQITHEDLMYIVE